MFFKDGDSYTTVRPMLNAPAVHQLQDAIGCHISDKVTLPDSIDEQTPWQGGWEVSNKEGRISKRISTWMYKGYAVKMSNWEKEFIGNIAARAVIPEGIKMAITGTFDWEPGQYGDEGSCFYGGRRQTWGILHLLGGRAALFQMPNGTRGRCLIVDGDDGHPVAFNFYGIDSDAGALVMAKSIRHENNQIAYAAHIPFVIDGHHEQPIWINKGRGYRFGVVTEADGYDGKNSTERDRNIPSNALRCEKCYAELANCPDYGGEKHPAYLCQACYSILKESVHLRWTMAKLIPVPLRGERVKAKKGSARVGHERAGLNYAYLDEMDGVTPRGVYLQGVPNDTIIMPENPLAGWTTYTNANLMMMMEHQGMREAAYAAVAEQWARAGILPEAIQGDDE